MDLPMNYFESMGLGEKGRQRAYHEKIFQTRDPLIQYMDLTCANHKIFHFNHIKFYDFILFINL